MATTVQCETFISKIAPLIQEEGKKRGYSIVSVAIAQACIESAWGLSGLAKYHNYFGMKCGSSWKGKSVNMKTKEEYTVGTLTTIRDNFRAYDSMAAGVAGYYDFINTKRYLNLRTSSTATQYAQNLKNDGYATSSTYVNTLISTVKKWGLTKYDAESACPFPEPKGALKKPMTGSGVQWLQWYLNHCGIGYNLCTDGIYGDITKGAVLDFQKRMKLKSIDGICGQETRKALKSLV